MGYICLSCLNEFNKEELSFNDKYGNYRYKCPIKKCSSYDMVEIDDLILPIIKILNQKGYKTEYCCSGHLTERDTNTYIVFDKNTIPKIIPKDFILENEEYYKIMEYKIEEDTFFNNMCIRKWYKGVSQESLYNEILTFRFN